MNLSMSAPNAYQRPQFSYIAGDISKLTFIYNRCLVGHRLGCKGSSERLPHARMGCVVVCDNDVIGPIWWRYVHHGVLLKPRLVQHQL
jgi:hypothetical protein